MRMVGLVVAVLQTQAPVVRSVRVAPDEVVQVTEAGQGPAVLLVPGLIGSAFGYRKIIPLLVEDGYSVIAIEPLGVGGSGRPARADYSLGAQASRLGAVLDTLGVRGVIVVAHAVGGSIGLRLAHGRPDLVSGLVLLEGGPVESASTPGFRRAMKFAPLLRLFGGVGRIRRELNKQLRRDSGDPSWVDPDVIEGYTADAARDLGAVLRTYRAMASARESDSISTHLEDITVPVRLLIGGAHHGGGPDASEVERMSLHLPDFAVDTLPGIGHFPHEEAPQVVRLAVRQVRDRLILTEPAPEPALAVPVPALLPRVTRSGTRTGRGRRRQP